MATTQKLLGEAVGIQFTGTRDETGTNPILGLTDGLIVGRFRRGRMDKPMRITQQNIRAELGYEPNNKFYQSVQNTLDNFPHVDVLRVGPSQEEPEFGDWILNQGFTIVGDDIRYTGYKTNGIDTYDSFALSNLQDALVKSFHDPDLQQYIAFTTAVEQLTGTVDWVLDPANNQIRYKDPDASNSCTATNGCGAIDFYLFRRTPIVYTYYTSADAACRAVASSYSQSLVRVEKFYDAQGRVNGAMCHTKTSSGSSDRWGLDVIANPAYDPNANNEEREKTLSLDVVAAQVISNAESSTDEVLQMLSEDYITLVANSIFDNNPSKQFVKLEDLIPQLEANKVLR